MATRSFVPSNQVRGFRQVQSLPITQDNQQFTVDIPRGPHIEAVMIRVTGSITNTVAWAGGLRSNAPYHYLRSIQWVLNSSVTLDSLSGIQVPMTYFTRRNMPDVVNPSAAAAPTTWEATYILDRALMDLMRPKDALLKTDVGVANNQLRLQFGAIADMFQAGAGSATYTSVQASVSVIDYQEQRAQNGDTPTPLFYVKRTGQRIALPSAGSGQQIKLNTGNRLRAIAIRTLVSATLEPAAGLVTRFSVRRAGDTRVDFTEGDLARLNSMQYGSYGFGGLVANNQIPGLRIIDFANPGFLGVKYSEFWPIPSGADTFLIVDTSAASVLDIVTLEGVDLPQPKRA